MISVGAFENELLYSTLSAVNKSLIFPALIETQLRSQRHSLPRESNPKNDREVL